MGPEVTTNAVAAIRAENPDRATMWTIEELDALSAKSAVEPPPPPAAAAAPSISRADSPPAGTGKGAAVSRPATPEAPLPWPRLVLLSLPMVIFLLGVCLLPGRRR
jgi:hypothetical protein